MCFSANVSYGAGALLIATGAITTLGNSSKQQRMIAAIPFLFGVQQVAEGLVWQGLEGQLSPSLKQAGILFFIFFALVAWPSWLPWSLYHIEKIHSRKRILKVISMMGLGVSILAVSVLYGIDVQAYPVGHSLSYAFPNVRKIWPDSIDLLLYDIPTLLPFFVSSLRTVKKAGYLVFASMILAHIINHETTASVWCFFAAIISLYIAVNILWLQKGQIT